MLMSKYFYYYIYYNIYHLYKDIYNYWSKDSMEDLVNEGLYISLDSCLNSLNIPIRTLRTFFTKLEIILLFFIILRPFN